MRIAITADPFIPVPPVNYGGIERIIDFLAKGLAVRGHEVLLVAHPDSKVNVSLIKYPPLSGGITGHIKNVIAITKLKSFKPDIIHSFSRLAYLLPFLQSGTPKLMSYQRSPTISQIKKAVSLSRRNSLAFTGCSAYISDQIKPYAASYPIFNGIELGVYDFNSSVSEDAPLVFLGRIEPIKGTHHAIDIAKRCNKSLVIAGNIPTEYQNYFDEKIKPFLGKDVRYVGPVNDQQKNELLGSAAAFLMPIEWDEPFGIVMAEAMACGTPVIALNRGSVPEVVIDGYNGFRSNSIDEMVASVKKIGMISRENVRTDAEKRFSSETIIDQYIRVYKDLSIQ